MAPSDAADAKIPCPTPQHLLAELETLGTVLEPPEREDTWEKFEKAIIRFAGVTRGGGYKHLDVYIDGVGRKGVGPRLVDCMLSDRGRLSGVSTDLLTTLAPRLGSHFNPLIPIYLPPLVRLLARPNKVYLKRAEKCLSTIITHCQLPSIVPHLRLGLDDKAETCRRLSATGLERAVTEWGRDIWGEKGVREFEGCLRKMATDKDAEVRRVSKRVWAGYNALWPERVEEFSAPLTPTIRRYLDIPAQNGGPSKVKIPARPVTVPSSRSVSASSSSSTNPPVAAQRPQQQRVHALQAKPSRPHVQPGIPDENAQHRAADHRVFDIETGMFIEIPSVHGAGIKFSAPGPSRPVTSPTEEVNLVADNAKPVLSGPSRPAELPGGLGRHGRSVSHNILPLTSSSSITDLHSRPNANPLANPSRPHLSSSFSTNTLPTENTDQTIQPNRRFAPPARILRPALEEGENDYIQTGTRTLGGPVRPAMNDRWASATLGRRPNALGAAHRRVVTTPGAFVEGCAAVVPMSVQTPGILSRSVRERVKEMENEKDDVQSGSPRRGSPSKPMGAVSSTSKAEPPMVPLPPSPLQDQRPQSIPLPSSPVLAIPVESAVDEKSSPLPPRLKILSTFDSPLMPVIPRFAGGSSVFDTSMEGNVTDSVKEVILAQEVNEPAAEVVEALEGLGEIQEEVASDMDRGVSAKNLDHEIVGDSHEDIKDSTDVTSAIKTSETLADSSAIHSVETTTIVPPLPVPEYIAVLPMTTVVVVDSTEDPIPEVFIEKKSLHTSQNKAPAFAASRQPSKAVASTRRVVSNPARKPFIPTSKPSAKESLASSTSSNQTSTTVAKDSRVNPVEPVKPVAGPSKVLNDDKPVETSLPPPPIPKATTVTRTATTSSNLTRPTAATASRAAAAASVKSEQSKTTRAGTFIATSTGASRAPKVLATTALPPIKKEKIKLKPALPSFRPTKKSSTVPATGNGISASTSSTSSRGADSLAPKSRADIGNDVKVSSMAVGSNAKARPENIPLPRSPVRKVEPLEIALPQSSSVEVTIEKRNQDLTGSQIGTKPQQIPLPPSPSTELNCQQESQEATTLPVPEPSGPLISDHDTRTRVDSVSSRSVASHASSMITDVGSSSVDSDLHELDIEGVDDDLEGVTFNYSRHLDSNQILEAKVRTAGVIKARENLEKNGMTLPFPSTSEIMPLAQKRSTTPTKSEYFLSTKTDMTGPSTTPRTTPPSLKMEKSVAKFGTPSMGERKALSVRDANLSTPGSTVVAVDMV